ncbi:hypothetical protein AR457_02240 [Streptomyces agglomeratus]|uniref:hypothetical protein n=1 Tax=Streptomyces agglomeratus TaxID=285458 RepID=UPI000854C72F|nr:hypothetical protein [Streptomyces agglomeratus]OEJ43095.1 hypothetical protein AR457_02240 [Streptomyces agglomeratus]
MNPTTRWTALACLGSVALLAGCTTAGAPSPGRSSVAPGPTITSTVAPDAAVQVAERYRKSGGEKDVYGIQRSSGPDGVPLLMVWTHDPNEDAEIFDDLKGSITGYLVREEGLSLRRGYLMDVFGPDGGLQHRLDARH